MRRLNETSRFVQATCRPGGLHRFGDAFSITVRVRLMHVQVRRMIRMSGRWRTGLWGEPINQHDMAGTFLLFSEVVLVGLRRFGFRISREEAEQYMQLWRYSAYLIGLDPELLCASEEEAMRLGELMRSIQGPPDDDSRAQLDVPKDSFRHFIPVLRAFVSRMEGVRERVDVAQQLALSQGTRYWDDVLRVGLARSYRSNQPSRPADRSRARPARAHRHARFSNPRIEHDRSHARRPRRGGCLSVAGYMALVERQLEVEVTGLDGEGAPLRWRARGWPARILQHEIDHLRGTLYIDRMLSRSFSTNEEVAARWLSHPVDEVRAALRV